MCPFTNRINIDPRKSPKLSRATQEISRSPRLPIRKPSIGSPSLTRREFPLDDITQVKAKLFVLNSLFSMPLLYCCHIWIGEVTCVYRGGSSILSDDKLTLFVSCSFHFYKCIYSVYFSLFKKFI